MSIARCLPLALAVVALHAPLAVSAADAPASKGSWFGFGGDAKAPTKTKKTANNSSPSKTPTVIKKMTDAPKRLVSSTKSMLTPKSSSSTKSNATTSAKNAQDAKPGFFKSLLSPEPPPPPRTIQDWMKLKQIHP